MSTAEGLRSYHRQWIPKKKENGRSMQNRLERERELRLGKSLLAACYNANTNQVADLMDQGAPIGYRNSNRETPIYAAAGTHIDFFNFVLRFNPNLQVSTCTGQCLIHNATRSENLDLVKRIVELDPGQVNCQAWNGYTALHIAVKFSAPPEVAKCLIEAGADLDLACYSGSTPLHHAVRNARFELVNLFIEHGASLLVTTKEYSNSKKEDVMHVALKKFDGNTERVLRALIKAGATIKCCSSCAKGKKPCILVNEKSFGLYHRLLSERQ